MLITIYVLLTIFAVICTWIIIALLSALIVNMITKVPYCPTPHNVVNNIIKELPIKPGNIIYDIGCGDGRFLFAAEKLGAKTIGYEISFPSYARAQYRIIKDRLKTKIKFKNFYKADITNANILFCFLNIMAINKVEKQLLNKLKKGTIIATYGDTFSTISPYKTIDGKIWPNGKISKINFYKI